MKLHSTPTDLKAEEEAYVLHQAEYWLRPGWAAVVWGGGQDASLHEENIGFGWVSRSGAQDS